MINTITFAVFFERVQRYFQNGWPSSEFTLTGNEIATYTYPAIATVITTIANQQYQIEGVYETPDAFTTTYKYNLNNSLVKDIDSGDYTLTLPHPPVGLPAGVSIKSPTFIGGGGRSNPLIYIDGNARNYALRMSSPDGAYWWVDNNKLIIHCPGVDIVNSGKKLSVSMVSSRGATGSDTDQMNLSDEAIAMVFDIVVAKLATRVGMPKDSVNDGVSKKTDV